MKILFTICGRAGSKGLKNKNMLNFLDKPLVYYSISAIDLFIKKQSLFNDLVYDIVLNTDSDKLIEIVKNNKMQNVNLIHRTEALSGDRVAKKDVITDSYLQMKKEYDVVVDLDITSPLRTYNDLCNLINKYMDSKPDLVFSVTESRRNPYFNMVCVRDGKIKKVIDSNYTARQEAPAIYDMNASLYAYNPKFLMSDVSLLNGKSEIIIMKDTAVLDIDKGDDFELLQILARYFYDKYSDYREVYDNIR